MSIKPIENKAVIVKILRAIKNSTQLPIDYSDCVVKKNPNIPFHLDEDYQSSMLYAIKYGLVEGITALPPTGSGVVFIPSNDPLPYLTELGKKYLEENSIIIAD